MKIKTQVRTKDVGGLAREQRTVLILLVTRDNPENYPYTRVHMLVHLRP